VLILFKNIYIFFIFSLFVTYIIHNVKIMGNGSASIILLVIIYIFMLLHFFINLVLNKNIILRKSIWVLLLFFLYLIVNITIDTQDINIILNYTISTSGGIVLFYVLGIYMIYLIQTLEENIKLDKKIFRYVLLFFILIIFNLYLITDTYLYLIKDIRSDIFMLHDDNNYQRPANFLTINYIFLSILHIKILIYITYFNKYSFLRFMLNIFLYLNFIIAILLTQMIGSNNGFVSLSGILFLNILISFLMKNKLFFTRFEIKFINIFIGRTANKIWKYIFVTIIILLTILILLIIYLNININIFRIFGFGSNELSSITSRLEILQHFTEQFNISPIFGNILSHKILGDGNGEYMHSFLLSILTHLGFLGFILCIIYLYLSLKELFHHRTNIYKQNIENIYYILLFLGLFTIANIGTFFIWTPIWFLFGMLFNNSKREV